MNANVLIKVVFLFLMVSVGLPSSAWSTSNTAEFDGAIGYCKFVQPGPVSPHFFPDYQMLPVSRAFELQHLGYKKIDKDLSKFYDSAKVAVLEATKHGKLVGQGDSIQYHPDPNYIGKDKVVFLVEMGGYKIKVLMILNIQHGSGTDEGIDDKYCPGPKIWKISSKIGGYGPG